MDFKKIRDLWRLTVGEGAFDSHQSYKLPRKEPAATATMPERAFETLDLIAKGGAGDVFRARQTALHRDVALKKLRETGTGTRASFIAEGVVLAQLEHPNIVPVYSLDGEGSELALAMRLVGGKSWRDHLAADPPHPLTWHLDVLLQTCNAINFAHHRGILHNDLKPENVMVGRFGEVLVVDWGLAVRYGDADASGDGLRHARSIASPCGTPAYMAPELAVGNGKAIGPRTDVYLLGAVLHEILCGRAPHEGGEFFDVVARAVEAAPPALPRTVPQALADICVRALAARPEDRFDNVEDFQEAVRNFLRRRESQALTDLALQSLDALREELASEGAAAAVYNLFGECRFGFRQALRVWPDNGRAREGRQRALEAMAGYELANDSVQAAAALIAALPEDVPELSSRLARLRRRQAQDRAALGRLRREEDRAVGRKARSLLALTLAVVWSGLCMLHALDWLPPTPENHLALGVGIALVIIAGLLIGRRSFFANRYNRNIGIGALGINLGVLFHRWLCQTLGFSMLETVVLENELFGLLLGLLALTVDWRYTLPAGAFLLAGLVSGLRVEWAWGAMACAIFFGLAGLALAWSLAPSGAAPRAQTGPATRVEGPSPLA